MSESKHDKIVTDQGLTMRGVLRIERINCDAVRRDVMLRTWQYSRLVRRDFNFVTYKMFFAMRDPAVKRKVRDLVTDLREEAQAIECRTIRHALPALADGTHLHLRIVSEEARILLESILMVDKALAKLKGSELREVADENCLLFFRAYARLKNLVLDRDRGFRETAPCLPRASGCG